ncbi:MAG TPA: zf-HC2 domain-containing protein [Ilumatobacteraceae bacterium]|nr:zf-HC2 domain-containing protein [Ilumatobacteraceae bacterium]
MKTWMMKLLGRRPPSGMSCHQVGEVLQEYLDGHIDAERAEQIAAHLDECRRCGMEVETYERIKATLAAQRPEIPADSIDRLRAFGEQLARGEDPTAP